MIKENKMNPLLMCIVVNTIWMIVTLCIFEVIYENTDDHLMRVLLSGGKGKATSDIIFINIILSKILYFLCSIFPIVNWLGIIEEAIILVSFIIISYVLYQITNNYCISLTTPIILSVYWYTTLTFSSVAMVGGISAELLLVYFFRDEENNIKHVIAGVSLLTICIWLREMAVLGTAPFCGAIIIMDWKRSKNKKKYVLKVLTISCIVLLITLSSKTFNSVYYNSTEWYSEYNAANRARAAVIDYSLEDYVKIKTELDKIGISENDYKLIQARIFDDYDFFDNEALEQVAKIASTKTNFQQKINELIKNYYSIMERPLFSTIIIFTILSLIIYYKKTVYLIRLIYVWLVIHIYVIYLYCYVGRLPIYVQDGLYFSAILMIITAFFSETLGINNRNTLSLRRKYAVSIIFFAVFFNFNYICISNRTENDRYLIPQAKSFVDNISQRENEFYFMDFVDECARIYARSVGPFENIEEGKYGNLERLSSWDKELPVTNLQFENYEIESPLQNLLNDNIFLISNTNGHLDIIKQYYKEHMNKDVDYYIVEEYPNLGINIYQFQDKIAEGDCGKDK